MSKIYFIATAHNEYREREFEPGDIVIDPWRMIPDRRGVTSRRIGQHRPALISVLLPSRGRPELFRRMYDSLMETVVYPTRVEMIVWIDNDDSDYPRYPWSWPFLEEELERQQRAQESRIRYIRGERQLLSACWNDCYAVSQGEIVMHCGDDLTFDTPGWDVMVREAFAACDDKILFVHGNDLGPHGETFGTHGFVHRRWIEAVGYFLPPLFSSDWNDVWLNEVAEAIGRRQLLDFVTEHHHYTFGKGERDQTHHEREERGIRDDVVNLYKRTAQERQVDASKLRAVMA